MATTRRSKVEGQALKQGEMAYLLSFAGLDWPTLKWLFGYTLNRNAQSMARKAAQWGGLPWDSGRPPTLAQRGLLMGYTRKRGDGRGVTHGRVLCEVAESLIELGIIGIIQDGNRSTGARSYLLRAMGCSWRVVADIMETTRTNTVIASARKFGNRTDGLPRTAPVMVASIVNRGQRIYEYAKTNPDMTWVQVAKHFSMSETGARNSAENWVDDMEVAGNPVVWPLRMTREDPGRTAYNRYSELGTWQAVATDMGYATASSARDVARAYYDREVAAGEQMIWLPGKGS